MAARPSSEDVRRAVDEDGVEFLFAQFVDMHAKPSAKLIPAVELDGLLADGAGFAGFAAGDIGQTPDNPDLIAMPDVGTFTRLPWRPEIGWFACDVTVEGEEWPYCPRTILRHQLERARDAGFEFKIGCELEYFLVRRTDDGKIEIADPLDTLEQPCYDIRAQERGLIATFMPKPFAHLTGNGAHFHMSLWDGETNLFLRDRDEDPRKLGLTDLAYRFVAGLKAHAKAYIALTAPTVTSYKRLVIGAPASGATWAPAYVTYGWNNRTMMLRIPEEGRVEDRTVDGSCNPYLAATAVLAAGLDGIERGLDPGDPTDRNMYETTEAEREEMGIETLPANLLDATRELEGDEVLRKALGSVGDEDYVDYFVRCKRREWQIAHEQITQWELDRYLQLF
jgi:glutamine synthetase